MMLGYSLLALSYLEGSHDQMCHPVTMFELRRKAIQSLKAGKKDPGIVTDEEGVVFTSQTDEWSRCAFLWLPAVKLKSLWK